MKLKPDKNDRTLESLKVFPYVAWGLTIGFSFFVYNITMELKDVTMDLQTQSDYLQQQINTPVNKITDFEGATTVEAQ
tara:strand:+ start:3058 stop:3291 length:234 start_codon:yes stop_codon:yes gene_type:complete